ncbi:GntR family transcriptional regulator [uncultured Maritimibacter sp.]|uniref:GntR family transcriptional regulator n=1 Tax=uncultured Maritimibacter sp. TaxID=991866 RepID=UPI0026226030|nr:GntR family transcriptional regulator [uncultured Maritimibacter sp.]
MTFELKKKGKLYLEIAELFRQKIHSGVWPAGHKLDTLDRLAADFRVSLITVRQAVADLRAEGLLESRHGIGTFVAEGVKPRERLNLQVDWDAMPDPVDQPDRTSHLLAFEAEAQFQAGGDCILMKRLHLCNGTPYAIVDISLAREIFDLDPVGFRSQMVLPLLRQLYAGSDTLVRLQTLTLDSADQEVSRLLDIPLNAPVGRLARSLAASDGQVLYRGLVTYRGDMVQLEMPF